MTARAEEVAERYRASALESAKRAAGHLRATAAKLEAKADELLSVEHVSLDAIVELHEVAARGTGHAQNAITRAAHNHARAVLWQERAKAARPQPIRGGGARAGE